MTKKWKINGFNTIRTLKCSRFLYLSYVRGHSMLFDNKKVILEDQIQEDSLTHLIEQQS